MSYEVIWEEKGINWKYSGVLTNNDILQSNTLIYGDPRFDKMRYQIVDMLDVESFEVDRETMEEVAVMDIAASGTNPYIVVAVVSIRSQAERLNEIYETTTDKSPWETELFDSIEAARAWITSKFGIAFA